MSSTLRQPSLKRKAAQDENANVPEPPRKLPAIAEADPNQPSRPTRTAISKPTKGPAPLTKPRAPPLTTTRRTERATSAPPKSAAPIRPAATRPATRSTTTRTTRSTPAVSAEDKRYQSLSDQVASIEAARAADAERLAAAMDSERAKVAELQANQAAMAQQLAAAKTQELAQRQELDTVSDEINQLRRRHARELEDREDAMRRKEREVRELKEELRMAQDDLERERETVRNLKATLSHQSDAHVALTAQISAFQAQQLAMQAQIDAGSRNGLSLSMELEAARKRVDELERETREAESVRRKLHNMVQELKGNIRVFCRVRPLLPSDVPPRGLITSTSSDGTTTPYDTEDEDKQREEAKAQIAFPDKMDHKEIVLSSSSESATGQERKDEWMFSFDRVGPAPDDASDAAHSSPGIRAAVNAG